MNPDPWPWPGDSPLDRRSRIARAYREALEREAPTVCAQLDQRCRELGQPWVLPSMLSYEPDELLDAAGVADMCCIQLATVRQWRRRGLRATSTPDGLFYRVADVLNYQAQRRYRRAGLGELPDTPRKT